MVCFSVGKSIVRFVPPSPPFRYGCRTKDSENVCVDNLLRLHIDISSHFVFCCHCEGKVQIGMRVAGVSLAWHGGTEGVERRRADPRGVER